MGWERMGGLVTYRGTLISCGSKQMPAARQAGDGGREGGGVARTTTGEAGAGVSVLCDTHGGTAASLAPPVHVTPARLDSARKQAERFFFLFSSSNLH